MVERVACLGRFNSQSYPFHFAVASRFISVTSHTSSALARVFPVDSHLRVSGNAAFASVVGATFVSALHRARNAAAPIRDRRTAVTRLVAGDARALHAVVDPANR